MSVVQNLASAVTGSRVSDALIASQLLDSAKMDAMSATAFCLEAITPELRSFFQDCVNKSLKAQEELTRIAEQKEWYPAHLPPTKQLEEDLKFVHSLRAD